MKKYILIIFCMLFILGWNIFFMPTEHVPPSQYAYSDGFSTSLKYFRKRNNVDYLILGNSRTEASLYPSLMQQNLSQNLNKNVDVHSLAVGGLYLNTLFEMITKIIPEELPKNVIIGVSPADFDELNPNLLEAKKVLQQTYLYQASSIPYWGPLKNLEIKLMDVIAAVFPGIYYRNVFDSTFFTRKAVDLERENKWYSNIFRFINYQLINQYYKKIQVVIPSFNISLQDLKLGNKISQYFSRVFSPFQWKPTNTNITKNGGLVVNGSDVIFKADEHIKKVKENGFYDLYRSSNFCDNHAKVVDSENSEQLKLLKFFHAKKVQVHMVVLPAIILSACEHNYKFNEDLKLTLKSWQKRFDNLVVYDYLENFQHPYQEQKLYRDVDHMNAQGAALVSKRLASDIVKREQITPKWAIRTPSVL